MLNSLLQSTQVSVLQKALSAASLRHKVISNNIANVNTPKFKRSEVSFENQLAAAMDSKTTSASSLLARTHERHLPLQSKSQTAGLNVEPTVSTITENSFRTDDNNVDIDSEMAGLAKNTLYYNAVADQINKYFSGIKSVINGGK